MNYAEFYATLFKPLERKFGKLDSETLAYVIGFSASGPVSMKRQKRSELFTTCELAAYLEQQVSSEGLKYELFAVGFSEDWCRKVFTALGSLSKEVGLGDNHTVDVSDTVEAEEKVKAVQLRLFSQCTYQKSRYGLYRVQAA
ncbi:hypothetical protein BH24DEI2_BH24DEI2_13430 [soil metagenome]